MATGNVSIKIDIEPVVKLACRNLACKHNLVNSGILTDRGIYCRLKHLLIGEDGRCEMFERMEE